MHSRQQSLTPDPGPEGKGVGGGEHTTTFYRRDSEVQTLTLLYTFFI